jgi:hypothetical protein
VPVAALPQDIPTALTPQDIPTAVPVGPEEYKGNFESFPEHRGRINANRVFVLAGLGKSLLHLIKFMELQIGTTTAEQAAFADELARIMAETNAYNMQIKALVYEAYLEVNKKLLPRRYLARPPPYSKS